MERPRAPVLLSGTNVGKPAASRHSGEPAARGPAPAPKPAPVTKGFAFQAKGTRRSAGTQGAGRRALGQAPQRTCVKHWRSGGAAAVPAQGAKAGEPRSEPPLWGGSPRAASPRPGQSCKHCPRATVIDYTLRGAAAV